MNHSFSKIIIFLAIFWLIPSLSGFSTILPEDLPVFDGKQDYEIDPELKTWFEKYSVEKEFKTIEDINNVYNEDDKVTAFYSLIRHPKLSKELNLIPKYDDVEFELKSFYEENRSYHPLHNYLLWEVSNSSLYSKKERKKAGNYWNNANSKSCATRNSIADKIKVIKNPLKQRYYVKKLIKELEEYQDAPFKSRTYKKFVKGANKRELKSMSKTLYPFFSQYRSMNWMNRKYLGKSETTKLKSLEDKLRLQRKKRWCSSAVKTLASMANSSEELGLDLDKLITYGKSVAKCYRRGRNSDTYAKGWEKVAKTLAKTHGDEAFVAARLQKIRVYWSADKFQKAKDVVADTITKYGVMVDIAGLEKIQLTLAQIYENEDKPREAISNFRVYLKSFPKADPYDAYKSLILISADTGDWDSALKYSEKMIAAQDTLALKDRDVSKQGFAMFWGGRAAIKTKKQDIALGYWKRLAAEYYSTYYGALGHFLLETTEGKSFALQPSISTKFDEGEFLYEPFTKDSAIKIDRIKLLLSLGERDYASCEIKELGDESIVNHEKAKVAKALMYYASKNWVQAVMIYGRLTRDIRKSQPKGMERILFPVKYKEDIKALASKLEVDPYFVISLIRQESLFNPKAYSPAGAIGLMQMLRTTARLEARRLSKSYVKNRKEKRKLLRKTRSKWKLFDEETNLKIGIHHVHTLLKEYGSSVFTLSAYNAGPGRLKVWKKKYNTDDLLLFTEKIPYKETRGYVKLILRNYFYYKKIYGDEGAEMPHLNKVIQPVLVDVEDNEGIDIGSQSSNDFLF